MVVLAPELLRSILVCLDPCEPLSGVTVCRFQACCRDFNDVGSDDVLWQGLLTGRWHRYKSRGELARLALVCRPGSKADLKIWKITYGQRHVCDRDALDSVNRITNLTCGRLRHARRILEDYRMDVFDALLAQQRRLLASTSPYDALTAKLWLRDILDALRRAESLGWWASMLFENNSHSTIRAISVFSGFRGADNIEIEDKFDRLALATRQSLGKDYLASRPDQREVARGICRVMREHGIFPAQPQDFHKLNNNFISLVIDGPMSTLPMSLVCIFCAIATRIGLEADVVGFPGRILCRVSGWTADKLPSTTDDAEASETTFHVLDIFDDGAVLTEDEISRRLSAIGIPPSQAGNFLRQASPQEIVARIARNIITSLNAEDVTQSTVSDTRRSAHAAVAALVTLQPNNLIDALPNMLHQFPADVYSIKNNYVPLARRQGIESDILVERLMRVHNSILEADAKAPEPRFRQQERNIALGDDKDVLHYVGTIFRHRRFGYVGIIKSWDPRCCASETWMQDNNIDRLDNGGRKQPFYPICADDGSERYIAQINVMPMKSVAAETLHRLIRCHDDLGLLFDRVDPDHAIFVMNECARAEYPEDAAWQDQLLTSEQDLLANEGEARCASVSADS